MSAINALFSERIHGLLLGFMGVGLIKAGFGLGRSPYRWVSQGYPPGGG